MNYPVQSIFQRKQALDFEQSVQVEVYKIYFENKEFCYKMFFIISTSTFTPTPSYLTFHGFGNMWRQRKSFLPAWLVEIDRGKNKEKAVSAEEKVRKRKKTTYSLFFNTRSISSDSSS